MLKLSRKTLLALEAVIDIAFNARPEPVQAKEITAQFPFATIGIGSGPDCDGQILVTHDLLGAFPWFTPKFVQPRLRVGEDVRRVVREWADSL